MVSRQAVEPIPKVVRRVSNAQILKGLVTDFYRGKRARAEVKFENIASKALTYLTITGTVIAASYSGKEAIFLAASAAGGGAVHFLKELALKDKAEPYNRCSHAFEGAEKEFQTKLTLARDKEEAHRLVLSEARVHLAFLDAQFRDQLRPATALTKKENADIAEQVASYSGQYPQILVEDER